MIRRVLQRPPRPSRRRRPSPARRPRAGRSAVLLAVLLGCRDTGPSVEAAAATAGGEQAWFREVAAEVGLDFTHFNGMSGELYMLEVLGAGVGLVDYDRDGDLDVYLVQGAMLGPGKALRDASFPPRHPVPLSDRLYRNELREGGTLRFTDVTAETGVTVARGSGMGVAVGDYDRDGWPDLYVTRFGANQLLRNERGRGFRDVTAEAGAGDSGWSVPATFFDYDRDGWLDLFVGNYVAFDFARLPTCKDTTGAPDYCGPAVFAPEPDRLLRNRGDGTFEDVTDRAGMREGFGPALGAVAADFDGDGWLDLFVANDGQPNSLWINGGDGTFGDEAMLAGAALNREGQAQGSMGVDAGDADNDGDEDLFFTNLAKETNTFYRNEGGVFTDASAATGLAWPSLPYTGFGTAWADFDNDGWLDLLVANGAVTRIPELVRRGDPFPLHQVNQLFRNDGDGRFADVTSRGGEALALSEVSRGAAFGDLDDDGDMDVVITNNNGPARLLLNQAGARNGWLGVHLRAGDPAVEAPQARVALLRPGQSPLWRRVRVDGSYASANDPRVLFGLGPQPPATVSVRVAWTDGAVEEWQGLATGRYHELRRGTGQQP
jgi:hypothetical protein